MAEPEAFEHFDVAALLQRLRDADFRPDTRQYLIAHQLLLELADQGVVLLEQRMDAAAVDTVARHLGPVFCTSPEEQTRFPTVIRKWLVDSGAVEVRPTQAIYFAPNLWRLLGFIAAPLALAAAGCALLGAPLYYWLAEATLLGQVVQEKPGTGGAVQDFPAPLAQLRHGEHPVILDANGNFDLRILRRAPHQSLTATLGTGQVSQLVDARTPAPIVLRFAAKVEEKPAAGQRYTLGTATVRPLPRTVAPPQSIVDRQRAINVAIGVGALTLAMLAALEWLRRAIVLRRMPAEGRPDLRTLAAERAAPALIAPTTLRGIVRGLRRPRLEEARDLSVSETVLSSARSGGLYSPVLLPRRRMPEYLILSSRKSIEDHQALFTDALSDQFKEFGLMFERYEFGDDPRVCRDGANPLRRYLLGELAATHRDFTLVVFAEARAFFDPLTNEMADWTELLEEWPRRVLFTPEPPAHWTRREWGLTESGMIVLPATANGLRIYAELAGEWRIERLFPAAYARAFPAALRGNGREWLGGLAPPRPVIEQLLQQLHGFLGHEGFALLAACAIYPQISWPLTLHLAAALAPPQAAPERRSEPLASLARLPWFRYAYMPDWLRQALVAQLAPDQEAKIRASLNELLERLKARYVEADADTGGLKVALRIKPKDIIETAPRNSRMRDAVFLGFMSRARIDRLTVRAPVLLARQFEGVRPLPALRPAAFHAKSRRERWLGTLRWLLTFRSRLVKAGAAVAAGLLALGVGWLAFKSEIPSVPPKIVAMTATASLIAVGTDQGQVWTFGPLQGRTPSLPFEANQRIVALSLASRPPDTAAPGLDQEPEANLAAATDGGTVYVWRLRDGRELRRIHSADGPIGGLALNPRNPNELAMAIGGRNRIVQIWDIASGRLTTPSLPIGAQVERVTYSPDGQWLAVGTSDRLVTLWNALALSGTGRSLVGGSGPGIDVAFSPNGAVLATNGFDGVVRLWDVRTQKEIGRLRVPSANALMLAFSPDAKVLAAMTSTQQILLWDVARRELLEPPIAIGVDLVGIGFGAGQLAVATPKDVRFLPFEVKPVDVPAGGNGPVTPPTFVTVPDVTGHTLAEAAKVFDQRGLRALPTGNQSDPTATVSGQSPPPKSRVPRNSVVELRFGNEVSAVPSLSEVAGRVQQFDGTTVGGTSLTFTEDSTGATPRAVRAASDAAGNFTVTLPPGFYRVRADAPGFHATEIQLQIKPGSNPIRITLQREQPSPDPEVARVIELTVQPESISRGQKAEVCWLTFNAVKLELEAEPYRTKGVSSRQTLNDAKGCTVVGADNDTTYRLLVTGSDGRTNSRSVELTVIPVATSPTGWCCILRGRSDAVQQRTPDPGAGAVVVPLSESDCRDRGGAFETSEEFAKSVCSGQRLPYGESKK